VTRGRIIGAHFQQARHFAGGCGHEGKPREHHCQASKRHKNIRVIPGEMGSLMGNDGTQLLSVERRPRIRRRASRRAASRADPRVADLRLSRSRNTNGLVRKYPHQPTVMYWVA
jgi:hypothetical protein